MTSVADPLCDPDAPGQAIWPRTARRLDGALTIGGLDVRDLATEFGTPLSVCDEADFRARCQDFRAAFGDGRVSYAAGAFCCREVLRWAAQEGLGIAVCTDGELQTALSAGLPGRILTLRGTSKSATELARAMDAGVRHIVLDSFEEIARLAYLAERGNTRQKVLVRADTAGTGGPGFALAPGEAAEAVRRVLGCPELELAGLHTHAGPLATGTALTGEAARRLTGLAAAIRDEHGVEIAELNLGGGFALAGPAQDPPADPRLIARILTGAVEAGCRDAGLRRPRLTVEPGRDIAGPGTVTLYEVGTVRQVTSGGEARALVGVDGQMSDNVRTARGDARYTCVLASRESTAPPVLARVTGRHCESGDIVVREACLPADLAPGDLLAVAATGAYHRPAAGTAGLLPRPAVVGVRDAAAQVLIRRETIEDLLRLDAG
jgi:diaminopimelate decarboxylase